MFKLYWWLIALGVGLVVMFLLERGSIATLVIGNAIAIAVFVADPERMIEGSGVQ